ncbi:MAG: UvrD-helicase domain-containing protein [Gammaproteobacteria bacterium]|nr:UvrD-helicase domain-containing protein [Gammaproteobacteria bacterium]
MTDEQRHLEDDLSARSLSLDVSRSFIVQAPAGSGKTELLIQRYLKLLAGVDDPEEVLAITFTRKAAAEMQFRVLTALRAASGGIKPQQAHEQITHALAVDALQRDLEHGWQLIANPRRMRIQTLDSVNALVARLRPISSPETGSGLRIAADAELKSLYRAAGLASLDWLGVEGDHRAPVREVLSHLDNNTQLYVAYVSGMLATRDQWLPFVGTGQPSAEQASTLRQRFERNIAGIVAGHLRQCAAAFPPSLLASLTALQHYAADNLRDADMLAEPIARLHEIEGLPEADTARIAQWQGLADLLLTKSGQFRKRVDKRQGFPAGDSARKEALYGLLDALAENDALPALLHATRTLPPVAYSDGQWQVLLALFRLLPLAVGELRRLFAEQDVSDHIEIALTADTALGTAENPGDVALLLDYQVRHILVDEMQDTSSAQYRMLEALTGGWQRGDGRTLYCVGDPMQSIYRFRNAEVGQFLLAREHGIGDVQLTPLLLRRNFRSGQFLVDWFNTVFPEILADSDNPASGAVAYAEAVSVPEQAGEGFCHVYPVFGSNAEDEARTGCRVIAETLSAHPDDEMAVLVRGRSQLPGLLADLREAGIPYRAVEIDRLTDLPEVIEVLALTRAAAHAGDRLAWLSLLRSPWIGLTWADLHTLVRNDTRRTVWELLQDEDRLAALSSEGRAALEAAREALSSLVAARRTEGLRPLVEAAWMQLGGPSIVADDYSINNVYRYFDVLEKHERCGTLTDVAALESLLDLERVSSDAESRLQVMTMHRAKGLEFEHVLLFGLGRLPGRGQRRVLSWLDLPGERGQQETIISPVGPRADVDADPLHRFIELSEAAKDNHETARLLYVACTRARQSLHLIGHTGVSAEGDDYKPPTKSSLLARLWHALEPQYAAAFDAFVPEPSESGDGPWIQPQLRRFDSAWSLPEVAPIAGTADAPEADASDTQVEYYWVGTETRIAGTIVHRWLHAFSEGRASANIDALVGYRSVTQRWLKETGVSDAASPVILERVELALRNILSDEKGRWVIDGEGQAEFGLTGLYDGNLESVVLDRVKVDERGAHWIIDYKTSTHEGGDLAGFLRAEADRYRAQLKKYAALYAAYAGVEPRCALYFPLLQHFLEMES